MTAPSAEDMERWHRSLAQAAGILSTALARRRRSKTMLEDIAIRLESVLKEIRDEQADH